MSKTSVVSRVIVIAILAAGCGGNGPGGPPGPVEQGGFLVYGNDPPSPIACDGRPVQLNGNHTDVRLTGACRFVRVAGDHNDIAIALEPGGEIEIMGSHNDVTWTQNRPSAPPLL